MAQRFAGRTAVVTGGVSGIGAGIAQRLAAEGARVSLWDRDEAALARSGAAHTVTLDVTDPDAVQRAAEATAAALGKIDILVTSAGITGPNHPTWDYPVAGLGPGDRRQPEGRVLLLPRRRAVHADATATAGSSTSPRSPARRAIRTPRPIPRRRRA